MMRLMLMLTWSRWEDGMFKMMMMTMMMTINRIKIITDDEAGGEQVKAAGTGQIVLPIDKDGKK
eukprot:2003649-Rhodomonas_salina.3